MNIKVKTKHTPGPWYLLEKVMFRYSVWANTPRGSEIIAETGEFSDANARLIVAAPELLEVIKNYLRHFDGTDTSAEVKAWLDAEGIPAMRTVIAKAEGGD